jgi:hypothetical protein
MRRSLLLFGAAAVVVACAQSDTGGASESATAAGTLAPMIQYTDVAGMWTVTVMPEFGDSVLTTYHLNATADSTGWTITFPGRDPIPVHVMPPTADSIVTHAGPYESALRAGVQVTTTSVIRIRDGKLIGTATARYATTAADSVVTFRAEGIRM